MLSEIQDLLRPYPELSARVDVCGEGLLVKLVNLGYDIKSNFFLPNDVLDHPDSLLIASQMIGIVRNEIEDLRQRDLSWYC